MRHIAALSPNKVPRDGEFRFKERSRVLVERWQQILSANELNGSAAENQANAKEGRQQVNGDSEMKADQSTWSHNDKGDVRSGLDPDRTANSAMQGDQRDAEGAAGGSSKKETVTLLAKSLDVKTAIQGVDREPLHFSSPTGIPSHVLSTVAAQACGSGTQNVDEQVYPNDVGDDHAAGSSELARSLGAESPPAGDRASLGTLASSVIDTDAGWSSPSSVSSMSSMSSMSSFSSSGDRSLRLALEDQSRCSVNATSTIAEKNIELEIARHAAKRAKYECAKARLIAKARVKRERMRQRTRRLEMKYEREQDEEMQRYRFLRMQLYACVAEAEV
jgi:hypothetical protein